MWDTGDQTSQGQQLRVSTPTRPRVPQRGSACGASVPLALAKPSSHAAFFFLHWPNRRLTLHFTFTLVLCVWSVGPRTFTLFKGNPRESLLTINKCHLLIVLGDQVRDQAFVLVTRLRDSLRLEDFKGFGFKVWVGGTMAIPLLPTLPFFHPIHSLFVNKIVNKHSPPPQPT